jgi:hypothetical protein
MSERYQDFIGMYDNVFPDGFCDFMINQYEKLESSGYCKNRKVSEGADKVIKDDTFHFVNLDCHGLSTFNNVFPNTIIYNTLQKYFDMYVDNYDILKNQDLRCDSIKLQKTLPGGGYHVWHAEHSNRDPKRVLVYSFYLNTIEEAGETEFLYQKIRIPPKENTLIIWPAAYTHTHRGNVVFGTKPKYIITGWFYAN